MELDIEDLARRLVIGRKRDGRGIYAPRVKQELVEICRRPGVSVAKMARECGINANLLATWLRKRERAQAGRARIRGEEVDLGVPSTTGFADSLRTAFFRAPVPSGCTLMLVLSSETASILICTTCSSCN